MRTHCRWMICVGIWFLSPQAASVGEDWPRWRGPRNDGHVASTARVPLTLPAEPRRVWKQPAGDALASPVVARGKVFVFDGFGGREVLRALARDTGEELWRQDVDAAFTDSQGPTGPRCTPVVDGDRVYAVSCRGELQCREIERGTLLWRKNFVADFGATFIGEKGTTPGAARHGNNGSPWIQDGRIYVFPGGPQGASIACLDKMTGQVLWKSQNAMAGYAPPVLQDVDGKAHLLAFTAEGLMAVSPSDGALLWNYPIKTAFGRHVTTPVVHANHVVVSSHQAGLIAMKVNAKGAAVSAEPAWIQKETAMNICSPVAIGPSLFGVGPDKNLICLDLRSGTLHWSKEGVITTSADRATAGFLVLGTRVLALTDAGLAVMFEGSKDQYHELGRAQLCGLNWCHPAYSDGKLFLRDGIKKGGDVYCYDLMP